MEGMSCRIAVLLIFVAIRTKSSPILFDRNDTNITVASDGDGAEGQNFISCSLCQDPSHIPHDPTAVFDSGSISVSCGYVHSLGYFTLPRDNCTILHSWGSSLCQCGSNHSSTTNRCTLCSDGSPLPQPSLEGFPSVTCAELQVRAIRDDPSMCSVWQATAGEYCGCERSNVTGSVQKSQICRLCTGERRLPDPLKAAFGSSCGQIELEANRRNNAGLCKTFQHRYGGEACCYVPPEPTDPLQRSSSARADRMHTHLWQSTVLLFAICFVFQMLS